MLTGRGIGIDPSHLRCTLAARPETPIGPEQVAQRGVAGTPVGKGANFSVPIPEVSMRTLGIHVRSSRPRLFLLMALVPGLGCQSPAEPLTDVSALNLAAGPPVQSIKGRTALTGNLGQKRTFKFKARMKAGAPLVGRFSGNNRNTGNRFSGRLTCLTILNGNEAWFAGVVEHSNFPFQVDLEFGWRAVDGPDQVTFGFFIDGIAFADAQAFCDATPNTPTLFPNESGSIRIRG